MGKDMAEKERICQVKHMVERICQVKHKIERESTVYVCLGGRGI